MELSNIAKMSGELAELYKQSNQKKYGGKIKYQFGGDGTEDDWYTSKGYIKGKNGQWILGPGALEERIGGDSNYINPNNINSNYLTNNGSLSGNNYLDNYVGGLGPAGIITGKSSKNSKKDNTPFTIYNPGPLYKKDELIKSVPSKVPSLTLPEIQPYIAPNDYMNVEPVLGSLIDNKSSNIKFSNPLDDPNSALFNPTKSKENITANKGSGIGADILGAVPLAISAFQAARTAKEGYDKVKLSRVHSENFNPALIDPSYQLQNVGDTFATANEQMNQVSKKDYLRRRIQSATEESRSKSGVLGQISAANTQMLNQARQINQQNRLRADSINLEAGMQEENINAANKGAWQTARDYQLSNLGTMAGEIGRDIRLTNANEKYNDRMFDAMGSMYPGQELNRDTLKWENTGKLSLPANYDHSSINPYSKVRDWEYDPGSNIYGDDTELGQGINFYPNQVNRGMNSMTRGMRYNRNTESYINQ